MCSGGSCGWEHAFFRPSLHTPCASPHQINVANIDATTGKYEGDFQTYALCGFIRGKVSVAAAFREEPPAGFAAHTLPTALNSSLQGEADLALTELVRNADKA